MLQSSFVFLVLAIVAAFFGFGGVASTATEFAKVLFFLFMVVFLFQAITGWRSGKRAL